MRTFRNNERLPTRQGGARDVSAPTVRGERIVELGKGGARAAMRRPTSVERFGAL